MWINEPNTPLDEYRGGFQTRSVMTGVEVPVEIAQASFVCVVKDDTVMKKVVVKHTNFCLLYTSPSPRDATLSRMPSSA